MSAKRTRIVAGFTFGGLCDAPEVRGVFGVKAATPPYLGSYPEITYIPIGPVFKIAPRPRPAPAPRRIAAT